MPLFRARPAVFLPIGCPFHERLCFLSFGIMTSSLSTHTHTHTHTHTQTHTHTTHTQTPTHSHDHTPHHPTPHPTPPHTHTHTHTHIIHSHSTSFLRSLLSSFLFIFTCSHFLFLPASCKFTPHTLQRE